MENKEKITAAQKLFNLACKLQSEGNIKEAIRVFKNSIYYHATAKAHTHLGWAYSLDGRYQSAIRECMAAIDLDPDYGNPYNDLGTYLSHLKKFDEAIIWLEKALDLPDYEAKYFPLYNLGKIYEKKGDWLTALQYYNDALELKPDYEPAKAAGMNLMAAMN